MLDPRDGGRGKETDPVRGTKEVRDRATFAEPAKTNRAAAANGFLVVVWLVCATAGCQETADEAVVFRGIGISPPSVGGRLDIEGMPSRKAGEGRVRRKRSASLGRLETADVEGMRWYPDFGWHRRLAQAFYSADVSGCRRSSRRNSNLRRGMCRTMLFFASEGPPLS